MMGLGKPQLPDKFEVASFNRCRNIKGEPQIFGSYLAQAVMQFSSWRDFIMGLGKPELQAKLEVMHWLHLFRKYKGSCSVIGINQNGKTLISEKLTI